jgi:hypothetical protein
MLSLKLLVRGLVFFSFILAVRSDAVEEEDSKEEAFKPPAPASTSPTVFFPENTGAVPLFRVVEKPLMPTPLGQAVVDDRPLVKWE